MVTVVSAGMFQIARALHFSTHIHNMEVFKLSRNIRVDFHLETPRLTITAAASTFIL
jgi:hypothetical protein